MDDTESKSASLYDKHPCSTGGSKSFLWMFLEIYLVSMFRWLCACEGKLQWVRFSLLEKKIHCTAELFFFPENSSYIYVQSLTRKWIQLSIQDCGLELYDTWCSVSYIIIHRVWQCGININIDVSIGKCIYANLFTLGVGLLFYLYWKFSAKS